MDAWDTVWVSCLNLSQMLINKKNYLIESKKYTVLLQQYHFTDTQNW